MTLQIANPIVVAKVERLARATGLSKAMVVEQAIDRHASDTQDTGATDCIAALLDQMDRVSDRADALDPLQWDANGLSR